MPTFNRPPVPPASSAPVLTGLGQALRWLRERQVRKQYRVASDAGITKGMLSAYETGRQRPSLETLDKLLETLGSDLNDLHNALQIVNGRPELMKGWRDRDPAGAGAWDEAWPSYQRPAPHQQVQGSRGGVPLIDEVHDRAGADPRGRPGASRSGDYASFPGLAGAEHRAATAAFQPAGTRHPLSHPEPPEGGRGSVDPASGPHGASVAGASAVARVASGAGTAGTANTTQAAGSAFAGNRELYQVLAGRDSEHEPDRLPLAPLPPEEELALAQMLDGFHSLLRYWHSCLATLAALAAAGGLGKPPGPATMSDSTATAPAAQREKARPVAADAAVGEAGKPGKAPAEADATATHGTALGPLAPPAPQAPSAPLAPPAPQAPSAPLTLPAPQAPSAPLTPFAPTAPSAPSTPTAPTRPSGAVGAPDTRTTPPARDRQGNPSTGTAKPGRRDHGGERQ